MLAGLGGVVERFGRDLWGYFGRLGEVLEKEEVVNT